MSTPHPMPRHGPLYRSMLHFARTLHTYLSMFALLLFFFFSCTGFMLNHPTWFGLDNTHTNESNFTIPAKPIAAKDKLAVVEFLRANGANGAVQDFDWPGEGEAFHIAFKSPRSQCDADITLPAGDTHLTIETHGVTGLLTRLHTSKDAGSAWRLLVDITAVLLFSVSVTGLILWQSLPKRRRLGSIAVVVSVVAMVAVYWMCVP